ncbi:MAG: response regulator [Planctomycetia bacterium]|nr:response regulator [Planctomycetia bacterium]
MEKADAPQSQQGQSPHGAPVLAPAGVGERINILIVDDEPINLTVLETVLDDPGYRLVRAESADQALMALIGEEFALIILDINMPVMSGFELANMIKQRKKTAGEPIIFLTAYFSEDQHVLEGYGTGAVDYLHKPINATILRSKVAVFAELYRKTRECALANESLLSEVAERRRAQEQLLLLNNELEERVAQRTSALVRADAALRDADRQKDEFLATLAHELRNPLAPIRNAVQILLLKGQDVPDLQWAGDVIERQVSQMTRLVDDLLDVSRITTGKLELRTEIVELAKVVQAAVETSRPLIDQDGHRLTISLPAQPLLVNADVIRLAEVFANLLNNAAKYTERGGDIELSVEQQERFAVVRVKDTGIGIPNDMLPRVFNLFTQVDRHLHRSQGGLGIGLTLVKRLVEMHAGTVEARSDGANRGSEFIVRLPLVAADMATVPKAGGKKSAFTSQYRVLVVDDNHDGAETLGMMLGIMGNEIRLAHDGLAAVEAAEAFKPEVVLLDIGMPVLDGYDACRRIREQPWGKSMILIALTGWGQDADRKRTREAGFDHHLVKPVEAATLMSVFAGLGR